MVSKSYPKIAVIDYKVSNKVSRQQSDVDKLWVNFETWWRGKYHYHAMDPKGAVKLWYEFLEVRRIRL